MRGRTLWNRCAAALALGLAVPSAAQNARRAAQPIEAPADVALIGVTQVGNRTQAWLVDLRTRRRETVTSGDAAFGFRVKRIAGESVVLSRGGREFTLRMGDKEIPPVRAAAPAAPRVAPAVPTLPPPAIPGEVIDPDIVPDVLSPTTRRTEDVEAVPDPSDPEPVPPAAHPYSGNYYPGLDPRLNPGLNPYAYPGPYGYPAYGYPEPGYGYPVPGYPALDPYSALLYGGYPYPPPPAYAPYGGSYPGMTGFSAPWGAYPNRSGTGPSSGGLRWNPQTLRRSGGDANLGSPNPQTRRRRGY